MKPIVIPTVLMVLVAAHNLFADDTKTRSPIAETLASVAVPELPARAAEIVKAAKPRERRVTTVSVVDAALAISPYVGASVVGAIAKAAPEMAAIAAEAAARREPTQAAAIARAAVVAAPRQSVKIVAAVCRAAPAEYRKIALVVAETAPGSGREILQAVAAAVPQLRPAIERALASVGPNPVSVAALLDEIKAPTSDVPSETLLSNAERTVPLGNPVRLKGPTIGPPYIPLSVTPTNVTPSTSGTVPRGGRDYAAP